METQFVVSFFNQQGVPFESIQLILMLPVIATWIALVRQVVGIKAFGIYTPLIVTLSFLAMGLNGLGVKYGIVIFISIIFIGMVMRFILKKFRLLYLPRVAITLTVVSFAILVFLVLSGSMQRTGLASVSIFPLLVMIAIVEKFVAAQIEKGNRRAIVLAIETLVISLAGYYIVSWDVLMNAVVVYPWLVLLTIPINLFLGKWTGLRLAEYFRFRKILKKM